MLLFLVAGQEKPGLEEREPRSHDEVVRGKLQPHRLCLGDESKILVGESQHRDLRQVDLLRPSERQQEV